MAKLDDEHRGAVTTVEYKDFSGGLNTTTTPEQIAPNELAKAINVEMDSTSGCLKTVAGTDIILQKQQAEGVAFTYLMYDSIGKNLLVVDSNRKVYATPLNGTMQFTEVGSIDGLGSIEYTAWEDGIVITSGGKLQYYHNGTLETINDEGAPTNCHSPFIKDGRIYLGIGDELHASAIGDEHSWITDSNDASSAQWLQIGYKDGGNIVGLGSLSSDMVIFKDNHRAYHLAGAYPGWSLSEIGRQIDCKGFNSCVSLADQVLALGQDSLQTIRTTDQYGDMRSANVSAKVQKDIAQMGNIRLRYMPSLNQVWMINGARRFFFVDMNNGGFYQREYMSEVYDAVEADGQIYIIKADKLCRLNSRHMSDDGEYLRWRIQGKTMTTINQFLVKRSWVDTVPLFDNYVESLFLIDKIALAGVVPWYARYLYNDLSKVYHNTRPIKESNQSPLFINSDTLYGNPEYVYNSDTYLKAKDTMYRSYLRQISRGKAVKVQGYGNGGPFLISSINYNVAEV